MKLSDILANREVRNFSLRKVDTFAIKMGQQLDRKSFDYMAMTAWAERYYYKAVDPAGIWFRRPTKEEFMLEIAPHLDHMFEMYRANAGIPSTGDGEFVLRNMLSRQIGAIASLLFRKPDSRWDTGSDINDYIKEFAGQVVAATKPMDIEAVVQNGLEWSLGEGENVVSHIFYDVEEYWEMEYWDDVPREMRKLSNQIMEAGRQYARANPGALPADVWAKMDAVARSLSYQVVPTIKALLTREPLLLVEEWGYDYEQDEYGNYMFTFVAPKTGLNAEKYGGVGPCGDHEPRALLEMVPALHGKEICEDMYEVRPEELDSVLAGLEAAGFKRRPTNWGY